MDQGVWWCVIILKRLSVAYNIMKKDKLSGKNAVITGASSGIGEKTAYKLAENGANVVLASRSQDRLENIAENIEHDHDVKSEVVVTDVTEKKQVENLFQEAEEKLGKIDLVLASAGLAVGGNVEKMDSEEFHKMMDVNCDGVFFTSKTAIPYLKQSKGNLILIGSIAGQYPRPANPVYSATKWWVRGFGLSLSSQIGDEDIAVTILNPSEVRTDFASESGTSFEERFEEGEVSEPEDIADAVLFAAKQEKTNTVNELDLYRRDKLSDIIQ